MSESGAAPITYFSDVLCIWAYTAEIKIAHVRERFGGRVAIRHCFLRVFGDTAARIEQEWGGRGGQLAYADRVQGIAGRFEHVRVHPELWRDEVPVSSEPAHLFCKAVQGLEARGSIDAAPQAHWDGRSPAEEFTWRCRVAFFRDRIDIGRAEALMNIAEELAFPLVELEEELASGRAHAARARDLDLMERFTIEGSPTVLLNQGRQKLYGNVGYRIIEANIQEILDAPEGRASWC